ncbi:MAG: palindromic element RPE4 domain-containing protein [Janthinobacterium lividum]
MIYSRDPVKNTNKISIFYYFLDTVDKPRYDPEGAFEFTQQSRHGMTP